MISQEILDDESPTYLPEVEAGTIPFHPGLVLWLTGLSGAGKTTLSNLLKGALANVGLAVIQLDGDALRAGVCRDLGFDDAARDENIRRAAEMAKLLSEQGFVVLCSFISPLTRQRRMAQEIVADRFMEVFVDCSLPELIQRDPKGLYARAVRGEIAHFTGVSAPYEAPLDPHVHIDTGRLTPDEALQLLLGAVLGRL